MQINQLAIEKLIELLSHNNINGSLEFKEGYSKALNDLSMDLLRNLSKEKPKKTYFAIRKKILLGDEHDNFPFERLNRVKARDESRVCRGVE